MSEEGPGAMDKAKGLIKEAAGTVTGDEQRKAEGRAEREGDATEGNKDYFRDVIEKTKERSAGEA
jgi:uncharacterized protein YjbJ (UPF0337 family)